MTFKNIKPLSFVCFLILFIISSVETRAVEPIAQVFRVFGKVTQLAPGDLIARKITQGDKVVKDTSIVTGAKSFVQVVYLNGGSINVGPKSKVVIQEEIKSKKGLVNLLKGKIRSNFNDPSVRKDNKSLKFFIKTKTAAMGVRGTDFQTIYNPINKVTNLLTFEGEVSMARLKPIEDSDKKKTNKRYRKRNQKRGNKKVSKRVSRKSIDDVSIDFEVEDGDDIEDGDSLEEIISKNDKKVAVKRGQYSGVVPGLERASAPVKISPVQLALLSRNSAINSKTGRKELTPMDLSKVKISAFPPAAEQEVAPEGMYDADTGEFAPKAGGFIDLDTGLYIPPGPNSAYDEKLKLYVENKLGTVDSETGQYIPPRGLKLDASKGFVPASRKLQKNKSVLRSAEYMNTVTKNKILLNKKFATSTKMLEKENFYRPQELFSKNIFTLSGYFGSQDIETENDTIVNRNEFNSITKSGYLLRWDVASNSTWRPYVFFGKNSVEMDPDVTNVRVVSKNSMKLGLGIRYFRSQRWQHFIDLGYDQNILLTHPTVTGSTATSSDFDRLARFRINAGSNYVIINSKRYQLHSDLFFALMPKSEQETLTLSTGFTYGYHLRFDYWLNRRTKLTAGLKYEKYKMNMAYSNLEYDISLTQFSPMISIGRVF